jgi:hypothetical protein
MRVPSGGNIIEVLRSLGSYGTLILALEVSTHQLLLQHACQVHVSAALCGMNRKLYS